MKTKSELNIPIKLIYKRKLLFIKNNKKKEINKNIKILCLKTKKKEDTCYCIKIKRKLNKIKQDLLFSKCWVNRINNLIEINNLDNRLKNLKKQICQIK